MRRFFPLMAMTVLVTALVASPSAAQDEQPGPARLQVNTDYPFVTAEAGDTVSLDLDVFAPNRQEVQLDVGDVPDGWSTTLRGGGFVIGGVTADPEDPPRAEVEIIVPPTAEPGTYRLTVAASSGPSRDDLPITVEVTDRPVGGIQLTTDFAVLRGKASDTFRYDLDVTNQTPEEITLAFDATGPEGWSITAGPASEQRASTVTVAPGDTESVRVEADPPAGAPAGTYPIEVRASGGGQAGAFSLSAEVTGQAELQLVGANGRLDLKGNAGEFTEARLFVVNEGSAPLEDVSLSADPPADWTVDFEPEEIPLVAAGDATEVTVRVRPTGDAVAGDYAVAVSARGGGESSDLAYRFTVETSRWWGAIGIAIIVGALLVLAVVFRRFGRR